MPLIEEKTYRDLNKRCENDRAKSTVNQIYCMVWRHGSVYVRDDKPQDKKVKSGLIQCE